MNEQRDKTYTDAARDGEAPSSLAVSGGVIFDGHEHGAQKRGHCERLIGQVRDARCEAKNVNRTRRSRVL